MNNILENFSKYRLFINAGIQRSVAYRMNFLIYRMADICGALVSYYLWQAIYRSSTETKLGNFTVQEMSLYVFLSAYASVFISTYVSSNIGEEIKEGSIAVRLLKPISFIGTYLFDEIGSKLIQVSVSALPILGGLCIFQIINPNTLPFNIMNLILFLVSSVLSYLLNFFFNVCFGYTAFVLQSLWGANLLKSSIISFMSEVLIPLSFFPTAIRNLFTILPFSSLIYTPVMIYLGKYNTEQLIKALLIQIVWIIFFYILSKIIWKFVINRLVVQGG